MKVSNWSEEKTQKTMEGRANVIWNVMDDKIQLSLNILQDSQG